MMRASRGFSAQLSFCYRCRKIVSADGSSPVCLLSFNVLVHVRIVFGGSLPITSRLCGRCVPRLHVHVRLLCDGRRNVDVAVTRVFRLARRRRRHWQTSQRMSCLVVWRKHRLHRLSMLHRRSCLLLQYNIRLLMTIDRTQLADKKR